MSVPKARVVAIRGRHVYVQCPYCGQTHRHVIERRRGQTEHRAPGCGLIRSAAHRATGYRFTTEGDSHA